ncbi:hypothetical protein [Borrelia persica]|uniref:hypothetical protein n=1 Tax=Borrelia persica TaxID=44448 RepID=UPI000466AEEC|nr:hypothetical protein [Borrelia persica]
MLLVKGIGKILSVVLKGRGNPDVGNNKKAEDGITARTNNGDGINDKFRGSRSQSFKICLDCFLFY